jgi:hypothetical protein
VLGIRKFASAVLIALATIALTSTTARAATLQDDVDSMLGTMKTVYSAYYAPAAWKKQYAGYDLNTSYAAAIADASTKSTSLTVKQARVIFKDFVYAMKDYHTSISFTSTESASLPLTVRGAEGRLFIVSIDRTKLGEGAFPFNIGDELLTVDGKAANDVVNEIQNTFTANAAATDRSTAEIRLFRRAASRGFTDIPSGPVTLGLRRNGEAATTFVQLIWDYVPERIAPRGDLFSARRSIARNSIFAPRMDADLGTETDQGADDPYQLGSHTSFMPALGTKIWESSKDSEFDAYIYQNDDHKLIGYVRIPSYSPADTIKATAEFQQVIARMQKTTDSLVIDQVNNPGVSVFYLYSLVSMLSEKPMATPRHRMAIAQADVSDALSQLEQLKPIKTEDDIAKGGPSIQQMGEGYPVSLEFVNFMRSYAQFIISEWTAGRKLTNPYWIAGVDHINPNPVHYTKPILLLINELDYSGGDFFPTTMQDNKRVTILGTRTAGAGGYVNDVSVPNNVGVASFRVTQSIAERATGNPIENLGVTPDINCPMTAADFTSSYAPYVKAVQAAVKQITP